MPTDFVKKTYKLINKDTINQHFEDIFRQIKLRAYFKNLKNKNLLFEEDYRKINYDPTTGNNETVHKIISRFQKQNLLSKNISDGLKTEKPKTPRFT